jgi:hypothetical protein
MEANTGDKVQRQAPTLPRGLFGDDAPGQTRRRFLRSAFHADVELSGPGEANGTALDVSSGGLRVALDGEVEVGQCFRVVLRTPEDQVTRTFVQVVWCGVSGYDYVAGLKYMD